MILVFNTMLKLITPTLLSFEAKPVIRVSMWLADETIF